MSKTTGVPWMDQAFNRELGTLQYAYRLAPDFYVFDDADSPNAFFTPDRVGQSGLDGTVAFGLTMMTQELHKTGEHNNFTIPAVMAHEFGHIVQYRVGENLPTVLKELEADVMAGWYMVNRDAGGPWQRDSMMQSVAAFFEIGDYDFNNPDHHGTREERMSAFAAGTRMYGINVQTAFKNAGEYVRQLNVRSSASTDAGRKRALRP